MREKLNILIFGAGAREHAIAEAVSKSPLLNKLYLAQTGVFNLGEIIEFTDYEDLAKKCIEKNIDIAVFGPEEPLCNGIVDIFNKQNIKSIGVNKNFSQLESSKLFAKKFMEKHGIKTAKYEVINDANQTLNINHLPLVIKADGLCKGKGVVTAYNKEFAEKTIREYLEGKFGENSKTILLEEFLEGQELSLMSLWDGKSLLSFAPTRDFKKLNKSPSAPNTGGMGAYCPVNLTPEQQLKLNEYKNDLKKALKDEKADFCGFIYSGLIWSKNDWYVLEYNVRLGDPEAQAILTHLKSDFLSILSAAVNQELDKIEPEYKNGYSACLTIACQGYPKEPKDGEKIIFKPEFGIKVFHAGVAKNKEGLLISRGGRVLSLCTTGDKPFSALKHFAKKITMRNKYFRDDIDID